jgi:glutathione S-transferase
MKLYYNKPSPYARKVLVIAHEKRVFDKLERHEVDPWADPPELLVANPIGKLPALIADDGTLITESTTIGEYLEDVGSGPRLINTPRRDVMARAALAQGLIDAAFISVIERRRPADKQWPDWIARQRRAIERTLPRLSVATGRFDFGDIATACALAYLDFRLSDIPWRRHHPTLTAWLDEVSLRPSMVATRP